MICAELKTALTSFSESLTRKQQKLYENPGICKKNI